MEKEQDQNLKENTLENNEDTELASNKTDQIPKNDTSKENQPEEESLEEKILELEDKLARTFAEMENQRRRFEKEKDDAFDYGGFTFARESLSLIDNFDRAKQSLENDDTIKNSDVLKKILEHLDIVKKDLISIFKKNNIEEIVAINKKLDPNLHQAMLEIEDGNKEPGTIVQEIQKGYTMKERLLRPSLVAVSKKTEKKAEKTSKKEEK